MSKIHETAQEIHVERKIQTMITIFLANIRKVRVEKTEIIHCILNMNWLFAEIMPLHSSLGNGVRLRLKEEDLVR